MVRTLKLIERARYSTLTGYLFTDREHARVWLTQKWVKPGRFTLQEVEVGPMVRCKRCGGTGYHQTVERVRDLTVEEFLAEGVSDG
jgi:hypothetical protein